MKKNNLVSAIVTTKNSESVIEDCLQSLNKQTYFPIEVIVVDNNSQDATRKIAKKYTNLIYLKGPERSAQRNFGAKKAKGLYLIFLDSDMVLSPNVIKQCVSHSEKNNTTKAIVIPEESFGNGLWAECKKLERSFYVGFVSVDWLEGARFFPKRIFFEMNGYDEDNTGTEDFDLPQRVRKKYGKKSIFRIETFIFHNEGSLSLYETMKTKFYYAQKLPVYKRKNPGFFQKQASIFKRYEIFFSDPKKLFANPFLGIAMLFMKTCEFAAGGAGYLIASISSK